MPLNTVEELVADIRAGKMVILMDDEDRENEGDLVIAATHVRAEDINFMITHARGLVCLTLSRDRCKQLNLPLMVDANGAQHGTNFTLSIEAAEGISTGISPAERAHTIQTAEITTRRDFSQYLTVAVHKVRRTDARRTGGTIAFHTVALQAAVGVSRHLISFNAVRNHRRLIHIVQRHALLLFRHANRPFLCS